MVGLCCVEGGAGVSLGVVRRPRLRLGFRHLKWKCGWASRGVGRMQVVGTSLGRCVCDLVGHRGGGVGGGLGGVWAPR